MSYPIAMVLGVGKVKRLFVCSSCERPSAQWAGRCSSCGGWGTVSEHPGRSFPGAPASAQLGVSAVGLLEGTRVADLAPDREEHRIQTGFPSVDRVLGGGL